MTTQYRANRTKAALLSGETIASPGNYPRM